MKSFLFKEFLSFFKRSILGGIFPSNHHLLILDGHGSHVNLEVIEQVQQFGLDNMVGSNYKELDKIVFTNQVDKTLDAILSKRNIKNGFKVIGIWPFNPKAMDGRIKLSELYITKDNI